ncbi:hypothetical protein PilKf_01368 [Pillotina sp. SPG140]
MKNLLWGMFFILSVCAFPARHAAPQNSRIPKVRISEVRTAYAKPKVEYIEFQPLADGNLGGLRLFIGSQGIESPVYSFPSVEVRANEYIVLHLRTLDALARDEISTVKREKVKESDATEGRDLWIPGTSKLLRNTDVIFFMDQNSNISDALLLSETGEGQWNRKLGEAVAIVQRQQAWGKGALPTPADAVITAGSTATRTIARDGSADTNTSRDWFITASRKATPGTANVPRTDAYIAK